MDARTIGEKAGPEPVEKRGRGGSRPRRPALLATCALFLGAVPAALPAVAGVVSGDAVSAVLNGVAFSAAALAIGGILVPLSGTAEVLLTRRATRRGLVAGILFLAWAITATAIVVCLVLSYPGAWLANLRLMLESGEEGRLLYPVLLLFFSLCASWMAWSAAAEWGGRAGVIAMLPYAALPSLDVLSSAQIADETRREAQAVADEARLRVVKEGRPCPLCPAGLLVAPFLAVGLGVALPASLFVKGDGAAAAAGIAIALSSAVLVAAALVATCIAALVAGTLGAFRARRCTRAGAAAGSLLLAASPALLVGLCALLYSLPVCGFAGLYRAGAAEAGAFPGAAVALMFMVNSFWLVAELWNYALRKPEAAGWRLLALPEAALSSLGQRPSGEIAEAVRAIAAEKASKGVPWF